MGLFLFLSAFVVKGLGYAILAFLIQGTIVGLFFGLAFATILVPIHYICFRMAIDQRFPPESFEARQHYLLHLEEDVETAFDRILDAVQHVKGATIKQCDRELGLIQAETGKSFKCFGERITVKIQPLLKENLSRISLSSIPAGRWTQVDYGKNYENLKAILSGLHLKSLRFDSDIPKLTCLK